MKKEKEMFTRENLMNAYYQGYSVGGYHISDMEFNTNFIENQQQLNGTSAMCFETHYKDIYVHFKLVPIRD